MNNKGFATSAIMYTLLVLFLVLIFSLLTLLSNRKMILDKLKKDIRNELDVSYTITFNSNGGTAVASVTKDSGEPLGTLPTTTKSGYTFDGWYTALSGGTKITSSTTMPDNDVTYYAHWIQNVKYTLGQLVYFDPVNMNNCNASTFNLNAIKNGTSTCYKWRVITTDDTTSKTNITIQLDHCLSTSQWTSKSDYNNDTNYGEFGNSNKGPITVLKSLETATSSWNNSLKLNYTYDTSAATNNYGTLSCTNGKCIVKGNTLTTNLKARMITAEEVAAMTKTIDSSFSWTLASDNQYFFSNSNYKIGTITSGTGNTDLKWLIENTSEDTSSGATNNVYSTNIYGYWTLSPISGYSNVAWYMSGSGYIGHNAVNSANFGVRPVITISKSALN